MLNIFIRKKLLSDRALGFKFVNNRSQKLQVIHRPLYSNQSQYMAVKYFYKYILEVIRSYSTRQFYSDFLFSLMLLFRYRAIVEKSFHTISEWSVRQKRFWTCLDRE